MDAPQATTTPNYERDDPQAPIYSPPQYPSSEESQQEAFHPAQESNPPSQLPRSFTVVSENVTLRSSESIGFKPVLTHPTIPNNWLRPVIGHPHAQGFQGIAESEEFNTENQGATASSQTTMKVPRIKSITANIVE